MSTAIYVILRALFFGNSEEFGQVSEARDSERAFSDRLLGALAADTTIRIQNTLLDFLFFMAGIME